MKLTLGFSPCPNDTFIFDALVNRKIDTEGLEFEVVLEDVQTLNEWAIAGKLDISKISYGVLPLVLPSYHLLESGGALGKGVGPLLIARNAVPDAAGINEMQVAIPGEHTTAHLLFSLAFPSATHKKFMLFSEIENAVLKGAVDAGVIIHENRFTYAEKGLVRIKDLGEYWEEQTQAPIPLGGIVIKKDFDRTLARQVDGLIRKSCAHALAQYPSVSDYVKAHAQEMSELVMRQHIDLYVNDYSLGLGESGKKAVRQLLSVFDKTGATAIFADSL